MISNFNFWKEWPLFFKFLLGICWSIFLIYVGIFLYYYFRGVENILPLSTATELHKKLVYSNIAPINGVTFSNPEWVYYLKEWYLSASPVMSKVPIWLLLAAEALGLSLALAALSFQNSRWFLVGIIAIAGFLIASRTEIAFQTVNSLPFMFLFFVFGGTLFFLGAYAKKLKIEWRILIFLLLFCLFFGIVHFSQKIHEPLLSIGQYGLIFPIIIFGVFVFLIAHEPVAFIVKIVSGGVVKGKSSLIPFAMMSFIYLLNCLLIYLENTRVFDGGAFVISPIWLFLLSTFLGIWGFRRQSETLGWYSYAQSGAWIYWGMAIISLALMLFAQATANDPLIELLDDYLAIAHLSMGLIFVIHLIINFWSIFKEGLQVDRIIYKPKFSRLLLAKTAGIFLMLFLLIQKNIYSYNQLNAALMNALGDYYRSEGENNAAETFYKESVRHDYYNHKANYSLGSLAAEVGDGSTAALFYKIATQKNPSEQSFISLAQQMDANGLYFEALFSLKEGLEKFPQSHFLATNTAHLLEKAQVLDSVYLFLSKAQQNCSSCETEHTNMAAFWIENGKTSKMDSLQAVLPNTSYKSLMANKLAISRITQKKFDKKIDLPTASELNTTSFAMLYNYVLGEDDVDFPEDSLLKTWTENLASVGLGQEMLYLQAEKDLRGSEKIRGLKQLTYLAQDTSMVGQIFGRNLALAYLKMGLIEKSQEVFEEAGDQQTAEVLSDQSFKNFSNALQEQEAEEILQVPLSLQNYKEVYNKAPLNTYLIEKVADFLSQNNRESEAYQLIYQSLDFIKNSPLLWKKQVALAIKLGVTEYAQDGLSNLRNLMSAEDYQNFKSEIDGKIQALIRKRSEF